MSGKLDKSLDDIVMTTKKATRGRGGRVARTTGRKATVPVVGGITKTTKTVVKTINGRLGAPILPPSGGISKILVTGLVRSRTHPPANAQH